MGFTVVVEIVNIPVSCA